MGKLVLLLLLLNSSLMAQEFYISDSLANKKESTGGVDDSQWILRIDKTGLEVERILYKDQELYKRWITNSYMEEGEHKSRESYFFKDSLRTETTVNENDKILEEILYDSKGILLVHKIYEYDDKGKLKRIIREEESELTDYTLSYRDEGSLRSLQSRSGERVEWRSGNFKHHFLDTFYYVEKGISSFLDYKNSKLISKRISNDKKILEETFFTYADSGRLEKEVIINNDYQRRTERFYDTEGRLLTEYIYLEDDLYYSLVNTLEDGQLVRKQERSALGRNTWFYEYCGSSAEDDDPCFIRQFRNGRLLKETEYLDDKTIETLYRNNEAVKTSIIENVIEEEDVPQS